MKLTRLSPDEASRIAIATLRMDAESVDLGSREGVAASLRRAASFMCPTSPSRLIGAVLDAIRPVSACELGRDDVVDVLELLVASGDLLELRRDSGRSTRLLYLAPPSYIERVPGTYLLMGIRPYGAPLIEDELALNIDYENHTRVLKLDPSNARPRLATLGLQSLPKDRWVASPASEPPAELVGRYRARLDAAGQAGQLDGLSILDPSSSVRYYRGRWRSPAPSDAHDFIARRPQAYGADLWCLLRLQAGVAQRLIELPVDDPLASGRDEAWRYQAAADALAGVRQLFRIRRGATPDAIFDFFSPLPGFTERYMQLVGLSLGKTPGALFSYRVPHSATGDVAAFLADMLWMAQEEETSGV
ncbi:hypothetical protein [Micromonospora sp. NPDC005172]|uniref:hypothetical protein n=1 Tax=Micromonospora sp. NPDC005172 TaxID=3156867 RepID=UPI0033B1B140